jgi:putative endonuclease
MDRHSYHVYMVGSRSRVLYIGMTNNLERRVFEHENDLIDGFSKQYVCHRLVYYESFDDVINREKQLKRWNRTKKVFLIERETRLGKIRRRSGLCGIGMRLTSRSLHSPVDSQSDSTGSVGMTKFENNKNAETY